MISTDMIDLFQLHIYSLSYTHLFYCISYTRMAPLQQQATSFFGMQHPTMYNTPSMFGQYNPYGR